jgi:hypothetical protein|tara:strand:- start:7303 stop:7452 length:150 start_codon:yes stop_codon:yes gene_type:complete
LYIAIIITSNLDKEWISHVVGWIITLSLWFFVVEVPYILDNIAKWWKRK